MKNAVSYIALLRHANLSETPKELIEAIELIQKDAIMWAFQNTTENFNMDSIQGEEISNEEIYQKLIK